MMGNGEFPWLFKMFQQSFYSCKYTEKSTVLPRFPTYPVSPWGQADVFKISGMFMLPYSPRWLAKQGRKEEAKAALFRLHGGRKNAKTEIIEAEYLEMEVQIEWGMSDFSRYPFGTDRRADVARNRKRESINQFQRSL